MPPPHTLSQVSDAQVVEVANDRTETYLSAIRPKIVSSLQMVVAIFPTSRDDRYSAFKKLTCIDQPIPSQVRACTIATLLHHVGLVQILTAIFEGHQFS